MDAQARYEEIADDLVARNADVGLGKMMGMACIKRGGAHHFDPAGGRPMKEWVVIPEVHADLWPELAQQALRPSG